MVCGNFQQSMCFYTLNLEYTKIRRKIGDTHAKSMICQFLHNPWSDLSQILKIIYQHIFCYPNKISGESACLHAWEHQAWLCMHKNCMSTITHDKCSCMHAHDRIVGNISLENRKYVGGLSLKFDKALFMSCWEICLSLAMHFYL